MDFVFPKSKNELEFVQLAERLNIRELCLCYSESVPKGFIQKLQGFSKFVKLFSGIVVSASKVQGSRSFADFVIVQSVGSDRSIFEKAKPDVIFGLESVASRDSLHQRNSGLNHVLVALASKNNIRVVVSLQEIIDSPLHIRALLFGRIAQNIRLCKKKNVSYSVVSFAQLPSEMRNEHDMNCLLRAII